MIRQVLRLPRLRRVYMWCEELGKTSTRCMCRYASNGQRNCFAFAAANNKIKGCSPVLLQIQRQRGRRKSRNGRYMYRHVMCLFSCFSV